MCGQLCWSFNTVELLMSQYLRSELPRCTFYVVQHTNNRRCGGLFKWPPANRRPSAGHSRPGTRSGSKGLQHKRPQKPPFSSKHRLPQSISLPPLVSLPTSGTTAIVAELKASSHAGEATFDRARHSASMPHDGANVVTGPKVASQAQLNDH